MKPLNSLCAVVVGLSVLTGCHRTPELTSHAAGHPLHVRIRGTHKVDTASDRGVITGPAGVVTIEPTRMRVNSLDWVQISQGVSVAIEMQPNRLRVQAGKVTIAQSSH